MQSAIDKINIAKVYICLHYPFNIVFAVIGICYDLPAGNISISLNLATVHDASLHVGYATTASRLFVEEVAFTIYALLLDTPTVLRHDLLRRVSVREALVISLVRAIYVSCTRI